MAATSSVTPIGTVPIPAPRSVPGSAGRRWKKVGQRAAAQLIVTVLALLWLIPIAMMFAVAVSASGSRGAGLGGLLTPNPTLANFVQVWNENPLPQYFLNSILITVPSVTLVLLISSLAAFAFSRLRFWGRNVWQLLLIATLMMPIPALIIPLFQVGKQFGILNNYLGLILPYTALGIPFAVVVLTGYFARIPRDIEDAARLDGCSTWRVYWQIMLPLCGPALAVVLIWQFMTSWNEFILALVMMQDDARKPLILVPLIYSGVYLSKPGALFAILTIITVPVVILYLVMQRSFVSGLTAGSLKG